MIPGKYFMRPIQLLFLEAQILHTQRKSKQHLSVFFQEFTATPGSPVTVEVFEVIDPKKIVVEVTPVDENVEKVELDHPNVKVCGEIGEQSSMLKNENEG